MNGDPSTPPPKAPGRQSGWRSALADPALLTIAGYTLIALLAVIAAYLTVFTVWAGYDDEGTLLVTLQSFAQGNTLYADIYTPYGPFYFELFGGLLALTGEPVTTDLSRTTVAILWVLTGFLVGLAVHRISGRAILGMGGMIVAFGSLFVLANEPMHPQVLCVLLLGAFVLLATFGPGRRPLWLGAAAGALLAALLLTKLNLGVYAVAAVVLAAALTLEPLRSRRWLGWPAIAAVLALPFVVAGRDLGEGWGRDLIALELLTMGAVAVAAWPLGSRRGDEDDGTLGWLLGAAAGFAAAFAAILAAIFLTGATPADVYDGVVGEAKRVRDVNVNPFLMPRQAVDWALVAFAGAVLVTMLRRTMDRGAPSLWPGLVRAVAGLAIWFSVTNLAPFSLNPAPGSPIVLPAALAWIAAIAPAGVEEGPYKRFLRVLLPALAVAEVLQVYPVAGSQVGIASFTFVPVGGLLLADALVSLRDWSAARGGRALERFGIVVTVATVALAADFAVNSILRTIGNNAPVYNERREAVALAGASQLRLPEEDEVNYTRLVELIKGHRCTDFVGYPNVNSLYLWTGIEPPPPAAPGAWIEALDSERQRRVVREMRAATRPCAIRNDGLAALWLGADAPPDRPLERYLLNRFRTVEEIGPFQFMLPLDSGAGRQSG